MSKTVKIDEIAYLRGRLADVMHGNAVLQGAIEAVCSGARTLDQLREWHEGPRTKDDGLYSWREERRDLLKRIDDLEARRTKQ